MSKRFSEFNSYQLDDTVFVVEHSRELVKTATGDFVEENEGDIIETTYEGYVDEYCAHECTSAGVRSPFFVVKAERWMGVDTEGCDKLFESKKEAEIEFEGYLEWCKELEEEPEEVLIEPKVIYKVVEERRNSIIDEVLSEHDTLEEAEFERFSYDEFSMYENHNRPQFFGTIEEAEKYLKEVMEGN